jgi:hypothetical protein
MKKTTQTHNENLNRTKPLAVSRPLEIISLFDAAGEFLHRRPKAEPEDPERVYAVVAILGLSGTFTWVPGPSKPSGALPASPDDAPSLDRKTQSVPRRTRSGKHPRSPSRE